MTKGERRRRRTALAVLLTISLSVLAVVLVLYFLSVKKEKDEIARAEASISTENSMSLSRETLSRERSASASRSTSISASISEANKPKIEQFSITLSFAGDCTLGRDPKSYYETSLPAAVKQYGDYSVFLAGVQEAFANDDLTVVNLEGALTTSDDIHTKAFNFKGDPDYVNILLQGSVEACDIANNHSFDYGQSGIDETRQVLDNAKIPWFGYEKVAYIDVKGVKVALVGTYELAQGIDIEPQMLKCIDEAKTNGADLIVCSFHWGTEGDYYPEYNQKYLAHSAIDHGADLVVGHHPHVIQGIENYNGRYVAYSLGNFCFGGNSNPSDKASMIFQQTFTFEKGFDVDNPTKVRHLGDYSNYKVYPCRISSVTTRNDYRPTILTGDAGETVMNRIKEYSEGIR